MRYRKLDKDGDYVFGGGGKDFYRDIPEAPAQAVRTRLMLWQGEWFLNVMSGTPWMTKILGKYTTGVRDAVIRRRILGTEGVTEIISFGSQYDLETRQYKVQATINTQYGQVDIKEAL